MNLIQYNLYRRFSNVLRHILSEQNMMESFVAPPTARSQIIRHILFYRSHIADVLIQLDHVQAQIDSPLGLIRHQLIH